MKTKFILSLTLIFFLTFSCNKENIETESKIENVGTLTAEIFRTSLKLSSFSKTKNYNNLYEKLNMEVEKNLENSGLKIYKYQFKNTFGNY